MPEMTITYIQKNGSTHLGNEVVQTDHLPRVGELIYWICYLCRLWGSWR